MVTTRNRLVVTVVIKRTGVGSSSGTSHMSVVARAVVTTTRSKSSMSSSGSSRDGSHLGVAQLVALLALPKLGARAASVVVSRARAEALLLLVVSSEKDLDRNGEEEEETGLG